MKEIRQTEIQLKVTECASCTCGWCGTQCESTIKIDSDGHIGTTGHASATAALEGVEHLSKFSIGDDPNNIKRGLVEKRTYTAGVHIVRIMPSVQAEASVRKAK